VPLMGMMFGVDFNPFADALRVVSDTGQNLRLNPNTAVVATNVSPTGDGALNYLMGDANFGAVPNVIAAGYTNNFAGAPSTSLFDIDASLDILTLQAPPNPGSLKTIGSLGIDVNSQASFDISGFPAMTSYLANSNTLYTVNRMTGAATLVGGIGITAPITAIAVAPVPEPGTIALVLGGLSLALFARKRR